MRRLDAFLIMTVVLISAVTLSPMTANSLWKFVVDGGNDVEVSVTDSNHTHEENNLQQTASSTEHDDHDHDHDDDDAPPPPRMLLGIFTTNSTSEAIRRNLIRKTYLSTYKTFEKAKLKEGRIDRICALADLLSAEQNESSTGDNNNNNNNNNTRSRGNSMDDCLLVYAFVMGAMDPSNTTAPTDLLELEASEDSSNNREIMMMMYNVDRSGYNNYERDVVYLNIRENMNDGKTVTWFKYASSVLPSTLGIDLIAKVDSDTVVFPRLLLQELRETLENQHHIRRPARRVYGGSNQVVREGAKVHYMQGGFYFISRDVAQKITSKTCPRSEIVQRVVFDPGYRRSEDREMGHFVDTCANQHHNRTKDDDEEGNIRKVVLRPDSSARHERSFKDANRFRVKWKDIFSNDMANLRYNEVRQKYADSNGCPPTEEAKSNELAWFDKLEKMVRVKARFSKLLAAVC
jgi:hypothetical protein